MENSEIFIPDGWTYFAHRSNTSKWESNPLGEQSIIVKKLMSVVMESDIYQDANNRGKNRMHGYSLGTGTPFEIRCLICNLQYLRSLDNSSDIKNVMLNEFYYDRRNIGGCYGRRHHSIPKGEELMVIGLGEYDEINECEQKIIWTIPKRFIDLYRKDIMKNNNRVIGLNVPECEQSKKI